MGFRILLLLALASLAHAEKKRYDGYQLFSVFPSKEQVGILSQFSEDVELDFWYEGPDRVDILVPPNKVQKFIVDNAKAGVTFKIVETNIQNSIDMEQLDIAKRNVLPGAAIDYDNFNTWEDIMEELEILAARCPSCETISIGQSYQGRDIKGIRIQRGLGRPAIWIDATIHAREWLATATIMKIIKHFIDDSDDPQVAAILNSHDLYLLPVVNPDGYSYTWTNERLWRKNRTPNSGSTCIGTDLNRNYAQMWGNAGASTNPCSDTYRGASAGSEPETIVTQGALLQLAPNLLFSMHIHTYGHLWLIPWGSVNPDGSCNFAADHAQMMPIAHAGADAVQNTWSLTNWARGNSCATIYPASGITMDYSKGIGGVFFTVTPELRGTNFVIAASHIEPSFQELWSGIHATHGFMTSGN